MKLVIVSGLSGSGKSVALHTLEDVGYYCIDNLPAGLLGLLAIELSHAPNLVEKAAVGIDARNLPKALEQFNEILEQLEASGISSEILFLTCDTEALIKRFSETRRRHPLSNGGASLADAVERERALLEPIAERAALFIDTTQTNVHQLRDLIMERVARQKKGRLSLLFESFGYKHGIPRDADFVFDARCLPNPHWQPDLRPLTGRDPPVSAFLEANPQVEKMNRQLREFLEQWLPEFEAGGRSYLSVAVGCTGGQHRSVYLIERLAQHFRQHYPNVVARHRELP